MQNNCDGKGPHVDGEVRVLPLGKDPNYGNLILCQPCHGRELAWRRQRNKELGDFAKYDLPAWETLKVYDGAAAR